MQKGVDPESILLLTFTRRSAQEMIERAARNDSRCAKDRRRHLPFLREQGARGATAGTFGLSSSFTIYDEGDAEEAIRRCCNKMGYDQDKEFPKKNELKNVFSLCVNKEMSVDDAVSQKYSDYDDWIGEIKTVQKEYTEYKLKNNCLDYDDLLVYLKARSRGRGVREKISRHGTEYIMVDEFQDTNGVQADIVRLLSKKHGNIMAVGDDAQSIYGFRGANHLNILDFPKRFPGCKVIKLEENYRSTQPILDRGQRRSQQYDAQIRQDGSCRQRAYVGEKPSLRRFDDIYEEAAWVAPEGRAPEVDRHSDHGDSRPFPDRLYVDASPGRSWSRGAFASGSSGDGNSTKRPMSAMSSPI